MGERYVIVVGDPTTGGGHALEGLDGFSIQCLDGSMRNLVCVGHAVLCGQCGPTHVVEGAPAFLVNRPAAYDGCALACGHRLIAASQRGVSLDIASSADHATASNHAFASSTTAVRYDEQIQFVTQRGVELSSVSYALLLDDGRTIEGTTDAQGRTQRISTEIPQQIVEVELRSEAVLCCAQRASVDHVPEHRTFRLPSLSVTGRIGESWQTI